MILRKELKQSNQGALTLYLLVSLIIDGIKYKNIRIRGLYIKKHKNQGALDIRIRGLYIRIRGLYIRIRGL